jgi:hypothetical protein
MKNKGIRCMKIVRKLGDEKRINGALKFDGFP